MITIDVQSIQNFISNVAFPIAMAVMMGWYIKYVHDDNRKSFDAEREKHIKEVEMLTSVVERTVDVIELNNEYLRKEKN